MDAALARRELEREEAWVRRIKVVKKDNDPPKDVEILPPSQEGEIILDEDEDELQDTHVLDMVTDAVMRKTAIRLAQDQGEMLRSDRLLPSPEPDISQPLPEEDQVKTPVGEELYQSFVRRASRIPRLSEEEEAALGAKVRDHQDTEAAKKLVLHNMKLAIKMAHQYRRSWTSLMDLVQEASTGMATAAQKWDPDKGTRFGTYAAYWIRAHLSRFLMLNGRLIHTGHTRSGRKLYFTLPRIRKKLLSEGKNPTVENIAAELNESPEEVAQIMMRLEGREASLSAPIGGEDDGATLADSIAAQEPDPEINAAQNQLNDLIHGLVKNFGESIQDERNRAIWFEHLIALDPTSLVELGRRFEVSKQRMGQLASRLKKQFRCYIMDSLGPHTQLSWLFDGP